MRDKYSPPVRNRAPGAPIPDGVRAAVIARDGMVCQRCRCEVVPGKVLYAMPRQERDYGRMLTLDHILPKSQGGTHTIENLRVYCSRCNSKRGAFALQFFRISLLDAVACVAMAGGPDLTNGILIPFSVGCDEIEGVAVLELSEVVHLTTVADYTDVQNALISRARQAAKLLKYDPDDLTVENFRTSGAS